MPRRCWAAGWPTIYLGQRKTVMIGIVLMAFGHFMMASEALLFPALLLLIFGGGFFKTNTTAQVGMLYEPGDQPPRQRLFDLLCRHQSGRLPRAADLPARWARTSAGITASAPPASACCSRWSSIFGAGAICRPRHRASAPNSAPAPAAHQRGMEIGRRADAAGAFRSPCGGPAMSSRATPSRFGRSTIPTAPDSRPDRAGRFR